MRTVTITSGKGGVGKTNVAVNLALAIGRMDRRVLLVDADLGLANVDVLLGVRCPHTLQEVMAGQRKIADVLVEVAPGVSILAASSGILRMERIGNDERLRLLDELQSLATRFDLMLLDTGAGLTENVLFFSAAADQLLLVTTPEPTALTDSYAMLKVLSAQHDLDEAVLLVNQASGALEGQAVYDKLSDIAGRFLKRTVHYFGHLPKDSLVAKAVTERKALLLAYPHAPAAVAFSALAGRFEQVFRRQPPLGQPPLWQRWLAP